MSDGILKSRVEFVPPPEDGWNMSQELRKAFQTHSNRTLLVDAAKKRSWTGGQLLEGAGSIASGLIKQVGLKAGQTVLMVCDHSDDEILLALGTVLAGGAFYGATPDDGLAELRTLCELELPSVIVTSSRIHLMILELRKSVEGLEKAPIIWIDNPFKKTTTLNGNGNGFISEDQNGSNSTNNNNNNNNNNDDEQYWEELMQRDQVVLGCDLINGSYDKKLVEQVAEERINSKQHNLTYMLTSGSTGKPKVVASTHEELIYGIYSMISAIRYPIGDKKDNRKLMPMDENSILAGDLPLDHGAGLNTMLLSFSIGSKFIVIPSYDEDTFWTAVNDYRITTSIASTTFSFRLLTRLQTLIRSGKHKQFDLTCLNYITCVGSKLAFGDLIREINKTYNHLFVCQGYGATEIGFITMLSTNDCRTHLNSVGHLFPGIIGKVIDIETGKVLGPNERGELHVWAKSKFKQYKCRRDDDPKRLMEICHDEEGFYKTGDQVHYDEDGRLYVHGRFKDTLFLAQDWKILPSELEEVVNKHPLVELSAVLGTPDPDLPGCDAPRAFVKLISRDSNLDQLEPEVRRKFELGDEKFIGEDIYKFVAEQTAAPKHLRGGVRILEDFPKVGLLNKIDRKALKLIN